MPLCVAIDSNGYLIQSDLNINECQSFVIQSVSEFKDSHFEISSSEILTVFSWGFGAVLVVGYFSGYIIGVAKKVIRLI